MDNKKDKLDEQLRERLLKELKFKVEHAFSLTQEGYLLSDIQMIDYLLYLTLTKFSREEKNYNI